MKGGVSRRGLTGDVFLMSTPAGARIDDLKIDSSVRNWQITFGTALEIQPGAAYRLRARILPLRWIALALAAACAASAILVHASLWLLVPALAAAGTLGLSWNGLSFTAAAESAGRRRSGASIGLQQTFLSGGGIVAPIAFAAVVHHSSWRLGFWLAAASPLPLGGHAMKGTPRPQRSQAVGIVSRLAADHL